MEIGVELAAAFTDKLDKIHKAVSVRETKPVYRTLGASQIGSAPLTLEVNETVTHGRFYNLLQLGIFGVDGHTALTNGLADIYVASSGVELPDFSAQILTSIPIPSVQTFSKEVVWIHPGERIVALLYGYTGSSAVTIVAKVADYPHHEKSSQIIT